MTRSGFHIALIEDDPIMGESLVERLRLEAFEVDWFSTFSEARSGLHAKQYDAILSDIRLPDGNGAQLLPLLKEQSEPIPPTIFITGHGTIDQAVSLLREGAVDYLTKPLDIGQLVERLEELRLKAGQGERVLDDRSLGVSAVMRDIESKLSRLAEYPDVSVLFSGESGVGKEVAARYLHYLQCPDAPFEALNCAGIPDTLIGSELFGHEKGAFTGALNQRAGLFERAASGFAFLDEIGDMPLDTQSTLLRVLQERKFTRLGGKTLHTIRGRILFATHQDLRQLVAEGQFREDLFYRINVVQILIPPLRQRREDIIWLAERFIRQHNRKSPDKQRALSTDAAQYLKTQNWPGNIRELQNTIQRACILTGHDILQASDFSQHLTEQPRPAAELDEFLQHDERDYIIATLRAHNLRVAESAEALGITRKTLWKKMKKYGIDRNRLS